MRVLVTGAAGFAGLHLVRELRRRRAEVFGLVRSPGQARALRALGARPLQGDLARPGSLRRAVASARPDAVAHLAGISFLPEADRDPARTRRVVVGGALALLKAVKDKAPKAKILLVSTGMVYGPVRGRVPSEASPLKPEGVYPRAKAQAEREALRYAGKHGLHVVIARPFNHAGPGQSPRFSVSNFARQIARAEAGREPPVIRVGDLSARRNFTDVRDIARAYALLLAKGEPGKVYNLAGERTVRIRDLLDHLRHRARRPLEIVSEAARRRGTTCFTGQARRIRALGWQPRIPLTRTLDDVLAEWRHKENGR